MINGALPDTLAAALGQVLAKQRQEWRSERELAQAESRRAIAELEAKVATLTLQMHQMYAERVAALRDGQDGLPGETVVGPQGEKGEKGDPGETVIGPPGPQGEKGDPGEAIEGPIGPQGDKGDPGESIVGPPGPQGDSISGPPGPQGEKGDTGDPGESVTGLAGRGISDAVIDDDGYLNLHFDDDAFQRIGPVVGKDGVTGKAGIKGDPGLNGVGIHLAQIDAKGVLNLVYTDGISVDVGRVVGLDGLDGAPGVPGRDAPPPDEAVLAKLIGKAVAKVPVICGEKGEKGDPGEVGPVGPPIADEFVAQLVERAVDRLPPAERGERGEKGDPGAPGDSIEGPPGPVGPPPDDVVIRRMVIEAMRELPPPERGERGEQGIPGESVIGEAGPIGPIGPSGPPGKFSALRVWQRGVHYESDLVTHDGSTYCAMRDTAEEPPHDDWALVAARGEQGITPYVGEVCGLYKIGQQYRKFDIVVFNGAEWRAKKDNPGPLPGDGWALSAQKGDRGNKGERGERGEKGIPGTPAPKITQWEVRGFHAIPILSDGTLGPALDLYECFERYDIERR